MPFSIPSPSPLPTGSAAKRPFLEKEERCTVSQKKKKKKGNPKIQFPGPIYQKRRSRQRKRKKCTNGKVFLQRREEKRAFFQDTSLNSGGSKGERGQPPKGEFSKVETRAKNWRESVCIHRKDDLSLARKEGGKVRVTSLQILRSGGGESNEKGERYKLLLLCQKKSYSSPYSS